MKKLIIALCSLGLMFSLAQAQQGGSGGSGSGGGPGSDNASGPGDGFQHPPMDVPPTPPDITPPDIGAEIPEEIVALHGEVRALRDSLRDSRNTVLEGLDDEATREQRMEALNTWRVENSEQIEEVRALSEELRALVHENRPDGPWVDVPEDIVALREQLQAQRQVLAESRQQIIADLGENPTDEDVRTALEAWRADNVDAIAEAQALAEQLREWFRANRPDRPGAAFTPGMAMRRAAFRENIQEMHQNRMQLRNQLQNPDLSDPEREQIMATFREQQRELMQERRTLKRQQRINQGGVGGDRRPGG